MTHGKFKLLPHLVLSVLAAVMLWSGPLGCAGGTSGTGGRNFSGTVRTSDGAFVEGAKVTIAGTDVEAVTNANGVFAFQTELEGGDIQLRFTSANGVGVVTIDNLPSDAVGAVVEVVVDQPIATAVSGDADTAAGGEPGPTQELASNVQIILPGTDADTQFSSSVPEGVQCGSVRCLQNEVCCNQSCGICTPRGGACTQQFCEPTEAPTPTPASSIGGSGGVGSSQGNGVLCGPNRCAVGELCCNQSCGICTPPGGACIELFCE